MGGVVSIHVGLLQTPTETQRVPLYGDREYSDSIFPLRVPSVTKRSDIGNRVLR